MINRIKKLMELKEVSVASFAELLNVNRSSFNHYFSGRSMPSLELVTKILKLYPDISSDWLILGEGEILREVNNMAQRLPYSSQNMPVNSTIPLSENSQLNEDNQFDLFAISDYNDRNNRVFAETPKETQIPVYEQNINHSLSPASDLEKDIILENNTNSQNATTVKNENDSFTQLSQSVQNNNSVNHIDSQSRGNIYAAEVAAAQSGDSQTDKTIKKIIFFYEGNTFETFLPAEH
jgi:transcriptional regulator with XRE-family HTH domain